MRHHLVASLLALAATASPVLHAQAPPSEQVQVQPPIRRAEPPAATASAEELERRGDELRAEKSYLDAIDYYRAALKKDSKNAHLYNKTGISHLQMQRYKEAKKDFEQAIRLDNKYADAYNNLGVNYYEEKNYKKAIKQYQKAIALRADAPSYFANMGAAYFSRNQFEPAVEAYQHALLLDPDVLERTSRSGVTAQLPSPEDRAHYDYVRAKLYAKMGASDRSLEALRRALEEGYKHIDDVYKDSEFTELRKDPRFTELMASKPLAIPE